MSKKITKNNKKTKAGNNNKKRSIILALWKLFGLMVVAGVLFFALLSTGAVGYLPNLNELENPIDRYASQVISSDNKLLFTYSLSDDNRIMVDYSDLSPHLISALVSCLLGWLIIPVLVRVSSGRVKFFVICMLKVKN